MGLIDSVYSPISFNMRMGPTQVLPLISLRSLFIDLECAALRALMESPALAVEKMRRDRELWEKVREDRVPQGTFWEIVWPAWDCRAYGNESIGGCCETYLKAGPPWMLA